MIVFNLDVWDTIEANGTKQRLSLPNEPFQTMTRFEYESAVFAGEIAESFQGSIIPPTRRVKFFNTINTMHVIYTNLSSNLTSIKSSIRAIMPSNFITEPHWAVLHGTFVSINDDGIATEEEIWRSTPVTDSIDMTYEAIKDFCGVSSGYDEANTWIDLIDIAYVIRRVI